MIKIKAEISESNNRKIIEKKIEVFLEKIKLTKLQIDFPERKELASKGGREGGSERERASALNYQNQKQTRGHY